jgi:hypothetical protein
VNPLITFLIRLLEVLFVIGAIGCVSSVVPITAYRLVMILFEPEDQSKEEPFPTHLSQRQLSSTPSQISLQQQPETNERTAGDLQKTG